MMRKPTGHKEKYSIKSEISRTYSDDGTAARTRPFSFDDIMLRRRNKKQSDSVEDQGVVLEMVSGRVESDRHRRRDFVDDSERLGSKEPLKVSSRTKEKVMESEYKESHNSYRRSKIDDDTTRDSRKERGVNEKRKNQDRSTDDFDREHRKIYDDSTRDSRKERVVQEKRKNLDRQIDDFDHEHGKIYDDSTRDSRKERVVHEKRKNQDRQIDDFDHEHGKIYDDSTRDSRKERAGHEKRKNQDRPTNDFEKSYDDSTRDSRKERVDHEKRKNQEWPTNDFEREQGKIYDDSTRDRRKERVVHEKRKNHDRPTDDFEREHGKRYSKDYAVKDRDRGRSEHVSKRSQNVYDDIGKKDESRKWQDPATIEKKQNKSKSEFHHEDLKSRSKRSRSREHERDKSKRSRSPSPRGQKQRYYDAREHEELPSHSSKDGKKVSNNGSDNNKIKRHDASTSGLGGYSPRKRRSEGAIKMPSLSNRSPEKKTVGWDSPPVKMESSFPSSNKTESSNRHDVASLGQPLTPSVPKPTFGVLSSFPAMMNVSVDSIQLTQATRPKRRVYVENLPASASEAAIMQWLSGYLRPFGLNHVQGTSPCISCIVNKEKGQALVEFLTPEDASAALNFDGKSFSGNIIKIRRPKDYVESSTGVLEKPVAGAVSVKNIVEDSPNKIFIGGISKAITSEMLMAIASAFGPLKAYQFEDNAHLHSRYAFVEYADQSVTLKACAGLNGMKLGGQVLTVTQATPDASLVGNQGDQLFYGTPAHARPLLEKPTQVLKLNNVLDPHSLPSLSESELEEIQEDIRLECARFGMVKSINIIKQRNIPPSSETVELNEEANSVADGVIKEANSTVDEVTNEANSMMDEETKEANSTVDDLTNEANSTVDEVTEPSCSDKPQQHEEPENNSHHEPEKVNGTGGIIDSKHENNTEKDEACDTTMGDCIVENQNLENLKSTNDTETETKSLKAESHNTIKSISNLIDAFEVGCVLVEYKRTEACSMAAHCLHGRVFDGRSVSVEYVAYDDYCTRFHK